MKLFRPVFVSIAARPADHADVASQRLSRSRARQQAQKHRQVLQGGDHLLHAGYADVDAGRGGAETSIAFVGDDHQRAGFGDQEVGPADTQVGLEKLISQDIPSYPGHRLNIVGEGYSQL